MTPTIHFMIVSGLTALAGGFAIADPSSRTRHRFLGIMLILFVLTFLYDLISSAHAHDHWINKGNYGDPVFKWRCCGEDDCKLTDPKAITLNAQGDYVLPDGKVIDKNRMIPSEDQYDYICRWGSDVAGSNVRCLFIVAPGT